MFQSNACNLSSEQCKFTHICVGCGDSEPYDDCKCRTSKIHRASSSQSTEKVADVPPTLSVSTLPPIVKPEACQKRVLPLTSKTALEAEVRDAFRIRQQDGDSALFFELTYLDHTSLTGFLVVLDLLDHVRQGSQVLRSFVVMGTTRAHVTLDVLLATCASSPERTTSVRLVSSPIVFNFETVCLWAGPLLNKFKADLYTRVLFLFIAPAAMSTLLLSGSPKTTLFALLLQVVLVLSFGVPVFTTLRWKGVSCP